MTLIEWVSTFIVSYPLLKYAIVFLGAAFGGEFVIISLAFLVAQDVFPFTPFFIVSFLGTLSSDVLWFLLGKTKTVGKILAYRYAASTISVIFEAIHKVSRGNHLIAFIFAKFLIGTRIVVIFYVSKTSLALKNFISRDLAAIFIWLAVLTSIGYLSGLGFTYISRVLKNIYAGIGFIVFILLIIVIVQAKLKRMFINKQNNIDIINN